MQKGVEWLTDLNEIIMIIVNAELITVLMYGRSVNFDRFEGKLKEQFMRACECMCVYQCVSAGML